MEVEDFYYFEMSQKIVFVETKSSKSLKSLRTFTETE